MLLPHWTNLKQWNETVGVALHSTLWGAYAPYCWAPPLKWKLRTQSVPIEHQYSDGRRQKSCTAVLRFYTDRQMHPLIQRRSPQSSRFYSHSRWELSRAVSFHSIDFLMRGGPPCVIYVGTVATGTSVCTNLFLIRVLPRSSSLRYGTSAKVGRDRLLANLNLYWMENEKLKTLYWGRMPRWKPCLFVY